MLSRTAARPLRQACLCRAFSTSSPRHGGYESTIDNLRIDGNSRVIYQGMRGHAFNCLSPATPEPHANI